MSKFLKNPHNVRPIDDMPYAGPPPLDVPLWTENSAYTGSNKDGSLFFWHHLSRVASDPHCWNGDFCLSLPGGLLLMAKTFGYHGCASTMSDGSLSFEVIEPGRVWRVRFKGIAYRTTQEENRRRFLSVELPETPTEFDVVFDGTTPIYTFGEHEKTASTDDYAADGHWEQGGRYRGYVKYDNTCIKIDGLGWRDHSIGPRNLGKMNWSSFVTATFPSGRLFDWLSIGGTFAYIITADGEIKHAQEVVEYPTWPVGQKDFMDTGFNLSMIVDGKKETVRVDLTPHHFYWTWMTPSQFCAGAEPERAEKEKLWIAKEMLAKFTWDGEMTYGLIEMTRRFGTSEKG